MSVCTGRLTTTAVLLDSCGLGVMQKARYILLRVSSFEQMPCGKALSIYPSAAGVVALLLWACASIARGDDQSQTASSVRRTGSCRRSCSVIHTHTACCPLLHACCRTSTSTLYVLATPVRVRTTSGQFVCLHYPSYEY